MERRNRLKGLLRAALASAVIAVCALVYIPVLTVPITLSLLAVYASLFLLGWRSTLISVSLYIAMGALGLPVFSGFSGGVGHLLGQSGGYIFGLFALVLVYALLDRILQGRLARIFASALSLAALYTVGGAWYFFVYLGAEGIFSVLIMTLVFLPFDLVKILLANLIGKRIGKSV